MTSELPEKYGITELVLMTVNPFLLFAYWEVTTESWERAQETLGAEMDGARVIIRMYDISLIHFDGTNAHQTFDIDAGSEARGWYIPVWTADKSYCADLGLVARTGRFYAVVRSNIIHTPRAAPSHRTDQRWMRVPFMRRRKPDPKRPLDFVSAPEGRAGFSFDRHAAESTRFAHDALGEIPLSGWPSSRESQGS